MKKSAGTPALAVLTAAGIPHEVHSFDAGTDQFGVHAAEALAGLGIEADQVFKTLVVDLTAGKGPKRSLGVCCVPVTAKLSLKKAAAGFGVAKVSMADPADASRSSGYIPGGISPLGQKHPLPTLIDETAQLWDLVYVSGGKRGMDIGLAPGDLSSLVDAHFIDLAAS